MIRVSTFNGRKIVAVFGLGTSGLATVRALEAGGADVAAWDDNEAGRKAAADAGATFVDLAARRLVVLRRTRARPRCAAPHRRAALDREARASCRRRGDRRRRTLLPRARRNLSGIRLSSPSPARTASPRPRRSSRKKSSASPITSTPAACARFTVQCGSGCVSSRPGGEHECGEGRPIGSREIDQRCASVRRGFAGPLRCRPRRRHPRPACFGRARSPAPKCRDRRRGMPAVESGNPKSSALK